MAMRFWKMRLDGVSRVAALSLVLGLAVACGGDDETAYEDDQPVEDLYNQAMDTLQDGSYETASDLFDEVERQHPYSQWATKAQLMSAYSLYMADEYDEAIAGLDRFIQLHPGHRDVAYAHYLKGLSYYERITDVQRDQSTTQEALQSLEEVVNRFPQSEYARDSRLKIDLTRDHLAGKEMSIGRYYQRSGEYLGAINRFRNVVERFQTTTHVPEALHRLTESYLALGVIEEAQMSAAVLGHNFPGTDWYQDSYNLLAGANLAPERQPENSGSWLAGLFDWF